MKSKIETPPQGQPSTVMQTETSSPRDIILTDEANAADASKRQADITNRHEDEARIAAERTRAALDTYTKNQIP